MRDYLDIESAPYGEDCVQVNPNIDYMPAMMAETKRFKEMLERRFAKLIEKTGIYFKIARNPHDFGTYLSLQVVFDDENEKQTDAACFIESNCPETWDDDTVFDWPIKKILKIYNQFDKEIDVSDGLSIRKQYIPYWIFAHDSIESKSIIENIKYGFIDRADFLEIKNDFFECKFCKGDKFIVDVFQYDAFIKCPNCEYKIILLSS